MYRTVMKSMVKNKSCRTMRIFQSTYSTWHMSFLAWPFSKCSAKLFEIYTCRLGHQCMFVSSPEPSFVWNESRLYSGHVCSFSVCSSAYTKSSSSKMLSLSVSESVSATVDKDELESQSESVSESDSESVSDSEFWKLAMTLYVTMGAAEVLRSSHTLFWVARREGIWLIDVSMRMMINWCQWLTPWLLTPQVLEKSLHGLFAYCWNKSDSDETIAWSIADFFNWWSKKAVKTVHMRVRDTCGKVHHSAIFD